MLIYQGDSEVEGVKESQKVCSAHTMFEKRKIGKGSVELSKGKAEQTPYSI